MSVLTNYYPQLTTQHVYGLLILILHLGLGDHAVEGTGKDDDLGVFNRCDVSLSFLLEDHAVQHRRGLQAATLNRIPKSFRGAQTRSDNVRMVGEFKLTKILHTRTLSTLKFPDSEKIETVKYIKKRIIGN